MQDEVDNSPRSRRISAGYPAPIVNLNVTLQERILSLLRQEPGTEHHVSNMLLHCRYQVWRALKDMEAKGLAYHRSYPVRWPSGAEHVVKIYFPAGLADGMTLQQEPGEPDLIDRLAAKTIDRGKFVQKRNLALLKELGRSQRV